MYVSVRVCVWVWIQPLKFILFLPLHVAVFRKNEFNLYPFYSKKKGGGGSSSQLGGVGLTRKASFGANGGVRPFLHQYEVKGQQSSTSTSDVPADKTDDNSEQGKHSSAPSSPVKSRVVRRTLSFGAQPSSKGSGAAGGGGSRRINRPSSLSSSNCASSCNGGTGGSSSSAKQSSSYVPIAPAPPPTSSSSNKCVVARPCKYF
jgi:hypothetical protein